MRLFTVVARFTDASQRTYECEAVDYSNPTSLLLVNATLTATVAAPPLQGLVGGLLGVPAIPVTGQVIYGIEHRVLNTWTVDGQP